MTEDILIPRDDETDTQYRTRLRAWFAAPPSRGEWEHICSLAGVAPDEG